MQNYGSIKRDTENYLKNAEVVIVYNQERFNSTDFSDDMVLRYSYALSRPFNAKEPSWMHTMLTDNVIEDESDLFNTGYSTHN